MIKDCLFIVAGFLLVVSTGCTTTIDSADLSEALATFVADLARQVLAAGLL
jgi:hypothetical protein